MEREERRHGEGQWRVDSEGEKGRLEAAGRCLGVNTSPRESPAKRRAPPAPALESSPPASVPLSLASPPAAQRVVSPEDSLSGVGRASIGIGCRCNECHSYASDNLATAAFETRPKGEHIPGSARLPVSFSLSLSFSILLASPSSLPPFPPLSTHVIGGPPLILLLGRH